MTGVGGTVIVVLWLTCILQVKQNQAIHQHRTMTNPTPHPYHLLSGLDRTKILVAINRILKIKVNEGKISEEKLNLILRETGNFEIAKSYYEREMKEKDNSLERRTKEWLLSKPFVLVAYFGEEKNIDLFKVFCLFLKHKPSRFSLQYPLLYSNLKVLFNSFEMEEVNRTIAEAKAYKLWCYGEERKSL